MLNNFSTGICILFWLLDSANLFAYIRLFVYRIAIASRFVTLNLDCINFRITMKSLLILALFVVASGAASLENNDPISQESNVEYNGKYHYQ